MKLIFQLRIKNYELKILSLDLTNRNYCLYFFNVCKFKQKKSPEGDFFLLC